MNTSITIKPSELNRNFLTFLKKLIATSKSSEVTITLKSPSVLHKETPKEMKERLLNAKKNLDSRENIVTFSWKEFDALSKMFLSKK